MVPAVTSRARVGLILIVGIVVAIALGMVNVVVAAPLLNGAEAQTDPTSDLTFKLAEQVFDSTKLVMSVSTGILGALGFLFSDKVSTYWERSGSWQRAGIVGAGSSVASAVLSGLMILWATISLSADSVVRSGLPRLLMLQALELSELGIGVLILVAVAVSALSRTNVTS